MFYLYLNNQERTSSEFISGLSDLVSLLQRDSELDNVEDKTSLPVFIPHSLTSNRDNPSSELTGYVAVDLDFKDSAFNQIGEIESRNITKQLLDALQSYPYSSLSFITPSQKGLKVMVPVPDYPGDIPVSDYLLNAYVSAGEDILSFLPQELSENFILDTRVSKLNSLSFIPANYQEGNEFYYNEQAMEFPSNLINNIDSDRIDPDYGDSTSNPLNRTGSTCCNIMTIPFSSRELDCSEPFSAIQNIELFNPELDGPFELRPVTDGGRVAFELANSPCCPDSIMDVKLLPAAQAGSNDPWNDGITNYTGPNGEELVLYANNLSKSNGVYSVPFEYTFGTDTEDDNVWESVEFYIVIMQSPECISVSPLLFTLARDCVPIQPNQFLVTLADDCSDKPNCDGVGIKYEWPNNSGISNYTIKGIVGGQEYVVVSNYNSSLPQIEYYSSLHTDKFFGEPVSYVLEYTCNFTSATVTVPVPEPEVICSPPTNLRIEDFPDGKYLVWDGSYNVLIFETESGYYDPEGESRGGNRHRIKTNPITKDYAPSYSFRLEDTKYNCPNTSSETLSVTFDPRPDTCGGDVTYFIDDSTFPYRVEFSFDMIPSQVTKIEWFVTEEEFQNNEDITKGDAVSYGILEKQPPPSPDGDFQVSNQDNTEISIFMDCEFSDSSELKYPGIDRYCAQDFSTEHYIYFRVTCKYRDPLTNEIVEQTEYLDPTPYLPFKPSDEFLREQFKIQRGCNGTNRRTLQIEIEDFVDFEYGVTLSLPNYLPNHFPTNGQFIGIPFRPCPGDPNSPRSNPLVISEDDLAALGFTADEINYVFGALDDPNNPSTNANPNKNIFDIYNVLMPGGWDCLSDPSVPKFIPSGILTTLVTTTDNIPDQGEGSCGWFNRL